MSLWTERLLTLALSLLIAAGYLILLFGITALALTYWGAP